VCGRIEEVRCRIEEAAPGADGEGGRCGHIDGDHLLIEVPVVEGAPVGRPLRIVPSRGTAGDLPVPCIPPGGERYDEDPLPTRHLLGIGEPPAVG
jgi:hypothetical protein